MSSVKVPRDVFTVDSAQGRENQCTIFDLVLAHERTRGNKFVRDNQRFNIVIFQLQNLFIVVSDLKSLVGTLKPLFCVLMSLEPNAAELRYRATLIEEQRDVRETGDRDSTRTLQRIFDYFIEHHMVHTIEPDTFDEIQYVDIESVS